MISKIIADPNSTRNHTAVGWLTDEKRAPFQAGVLPLNNRKIELLFVTLDKSEGYHDRIAYHDYAISGERFH